MIYQIVLYTDLSNVSHILSDQQQPQGQHMSAIQRQSRLAPNSESGEHTFLAADSPVVIPHASYVGLGIVLSNGAATVTVEVDGIADGDFAEEVTLEGTGKWRWPDTDGMNRLYNARYVKITWSTGTLQVFQKG